MTILDAELLNRAREHDAEALAEIYDRYAAAVYRYLYRHLGDPAQSEDLTSEVFLKLLRALGTRRAPRDNLQGWLYRVAHNLAVDWFRQQSKTQTSPEQLLVLLLHSVCIWSFIRLIFKLSRIASMQT